MPELQFIFSYLMLGAFTGFMAGLFGIGGGAIMVPILTSIFLYQGIATDSVLHLALGTSMASIIITSFSSMKAHNKRHNVDWSIVKSMSLGILVGTFFATFIISRISSFYLALFFVFYMVYASLQMFLNKKPTSNKKLPTRKGLAFVGAIIGMISALVSIGGGSLTIPFLTWHHVNLKKAIGTSAAIGFPISIIGTLGYALNDSINTSIGHDTIGFIYFPAVILISIMSYLTAPYGVKVTDKLPVVTLKKFFSILFIILAIKMFWSIL